MISYLEALSHPSLKEEMNGLCDCGTWDLTTLQEKREIIDCHWVFAIKYHTNGTIERLKVWLVSKGYMQTYNVDYFSSVAKLNLMHLLILKVFFSILIGLYTNLMLKMHFYMMICRKKSIWSNKIKPPRFAQGE